MVEIELGVAIYSRLEAVVENRIAPAVITARQWSDGGFRWLGNNVMIH